MRETLNILFVAAVFLAVAYLGDTSVAPQVQEASADIDETVWYPVVRVVDGDTIVVSINNEPVSVRLIGIDSPEVETPYTKAECFGREASDAAQITMGGHAQSVRLETDPSQDMYDAYGRLLAYVYVPASSKIEGILVNRYMLGEGFAEEYTFMKPYKYQQEFKDMERIARDEKKGLWGACGA